MEPEQQAQDGGGLGMPTMQSVDLRGVVRDAENLLQAVAHLSGDAVAQARVRLQERLTQVREFMAEGQQLAATRAREAAQATDRYVHERPWQAIGIGVAIGIVLGFISRRPS